VLGSRRLEQKVNCCDAPPQVESHGKDGLTA
jgi:hypothetical protein